MTMLALYLFGHISTSSLSYLLRHWKSLDFADTISTLSYIFFTFLLVLTIIKRLRDIGASPWFALLVFVPPIGFLMAALLCLYPGENGNQYSQNNNNNLSSAASINVNQKNSKSRMIFSHKLIILCVSILILNAFIFIWILATNFTLNVNGSYINGLHSRLIATISYIEIAFIGPLVMMLWGMMATRTNHEKDFALSFVVLTPCISIAANLLILFVLESLNTGQLIPYNVTASILITILGVVYHTLLIAIICLPASFAMALWSRKFLAAPLICGLVVICSLCFVITIHFLF